MENTIFVKGDRPESHIPLMVAQSKSHLENEAEFYRKDGCKTEIKTEGIDGWWALWVWAPENATRAN